MFGEARTVKFNPIPFFVMLLSVVGALAAFACHAAPREIPIAMTEASAGLDARQIADYPSAIDAIVRVLVQKYKLPVPRHTLTIYSTREEFEAGLIEHLGMDPPLARTTASFAQAAVGRDRILVSELAVAKLGWPERIELMAHELVHAVQVELAGQPLNRLQWLTEGYAEWIAYAVTESLGLDDMSRQKVRITNLLRKAGGAGSLPRLADMNVMAQWIDSRVKHGYTATFSYSFLIVDYLIERHSFATTQDYFRSFRTSGNYFANFNSAFGKNLKEFQIELDGHFAKLLVPSGGESN